MELLGIEGEILNRANQDNESLELVTAKLIVRYLEDNCLIAVNNKAIIRASGIAKTIEYLHALVDIATHQKLTTNDK